MDYNTQREKLVLPEYGRHVQKMIEQVKAIKDKEKRSEQMRAVVQVMGILNPQIREVNDYKHKLWDHAQVIGGFDLDIDAPYPAPTPQQFEARPDVIALPEKPIKAACYGRNIENMIALIADREEDDTVFQYKCDNYYAPESEGSYRWNDPFFAIDWGISPDGVILSEKDARAPFYRK